MNPKRLSELKEGKELLNNARELQGRIDKQREVVSGYRRERTTIEEALRQMEKEYEELQ